MLRCAVVLATLLAAGLPVAAAPAARVVVLKAGDDMRFDVTALKAKPGESLTVKVATIGKIPKFAMAHNFVLLKKGTDAKKFAELALQAQATNYIPPALKAQVIAATGLAGPGETVTVTFKAPATPGRYDFICSFPGHFGAGMRGVLTVG